MSDTLHTLDRSWGTGHFVSIRKAGKYEGSTGAVYDLCECYGTSHTVVGSATVKATRNWALRDLPAAVLAEHYNPACRGWRGLSEALEKAYGPEILDGEVTVLFLEDSVAA